LNFALYEHPEGATVEDGAWVVYDIERNEAFLGAAHARGPTLVWQLPGAENELVTYRHEENPALAVDVELDGSTDWIVRCDRVEFPPRGVAYRHVHPGPGIRRLLFGELTIESADGDRTYRGGEAWFENAEYPVLATASQTEATAFVRVMLLPAEWKGLRTIRYLDPADDDKPRFQRADVLLEVPIEL
jgi:hypothetical protein